MYQHVLAGVEDSSAGMYVVESAALLATAHGARLTLVHAFPARPRALPAELAPASDELSWMLTPGAAAERLVESAARRARTIACGVHVDAVAEPGPVASVLLQLQADRGADVIVLGDADAGRARLRRGITRAVGRLATCDLVIVNTADRVAGRTSAA